MQHRRRIGHVHEEHPPDPQWDDGGERGNATTARRWVATWNLGTVAPGKCVTRYITLRANSSGVIGLPGAARSGAALTARGLGAIRVGPLAVVGSPQLLGPR